jgi:hypothetical protein
VQTKERKETLRTFLRDSKSKKRSQSNIFFSTLEKEKDKTWKIPFLKRSWKEISKIASEFTWNS